jgi:hypothetical protein
MNKNNHKISSMIWESLNEKIDDIQTKIDGTPGQQFTMTQQVTEFEEDWNPQGPVTISGTDITEEDDLDLPTDENDVLDSKTGRMIPYEKEEGEDEENDLDLPSYIIDKIKRECSDDPKSQSCLKHKEYAGIDNIELNEKFYGKQKRLDKNKNGRIDKKDFELLRYLGKVKKNSKNKKEVDEIDLSKLEKGGRYKYESPSFEDDLEYSDEVPDREGDSRMHLFRGKKAGGYLMGDRDVESFVSDFDNDIEDIEAEDVPFNKRRPTDDEYVDFEEMRPTEKKSFFSRMKRKMGFGEAETEEGNAFTGALAKTKKGGKFKVGGKTYTDKSNLGEAEKFIQKAVKKMEKKGTEGSFKEYCGGEVTKSCIDKAMKSGDPKLIKKANFAKNIKAYKGAEHKKKIKESFELTENEMIDLIEQIVIEEKKSKRLSGNKPKGKAETEKAQKATKKENDDYINSVTKKFKEYLKYGSKGGFETNPKHFPKGNGELAKMSKMAYVADEPTTEYIDNFTAAGQENLFSDEIDFNDEWLTSNIEGSSKTGNNPKWGNAVDTDVNKKRNKIRKNNLLGAVKQMAYNKAPQPATLQKDITSKFSKKFGKDSGAKATKILNHLESTTDQNSKLLSEEFDKIKNLIEYNKKSQ